MEIKISLTDEMVEAIAYSYSYLEGGLETKEVFVLRAIEKNIRDIVSDSQFNYRMSKFISNNGYEIEEKRMEEAQISRDFKLDIFVGK